MGELTKFEQALMAMLFAGDTETAATLRKQAELASAENRVPYGDAGWVTDLAVPDSVGPVNPPDFEVSDVVGRIEGMKGPSQFVVFIRRGRIASLEGTTYDEVWPDNIQNFELAYDRPVRAYPMLNSVAVDLYSAYGPRQGRFLWLPWRRPKPTPLKWLRYTNGTAASTRH